MRTPPNVVFVVIDTLRADRLGCYGNERGLTPFLDELAARGVVFSRAYAPSSWTVPSIASVFTSRHVGQHRVATYESRIGEGEVTLAEKLAAASYATAGFFANFRLLAALGYGQGFSTWEVASNEPGQGVKLRAAGVRRQLRQWLASPRNKRSGKPLMLYLHFMEPHSPYEPPEPFRSRFLAAPADDATIEKRNAKLLGFNFNLVTAEDLELLEALYDGEVASIDSELRAMFAELEEEGILDHAVIVVTADHGEEFKEHGRFSHGYALFEESVRVPLIFVGPGIEKGRVVERNVSLLDVAPTLLELAGLAPEPAFEGRSLAPLMRRVPAWGGILSSAGESDEVGEAIVELPATGSKWDLRAHSGGIVRGSTKLLVAVSGPRKNRETPEVYDLASDPREVHPNPGALAGAVPEFLNALREKTEAAAERAARTAETGVVDEATKEKLRALGYQP